MAAFQTIVGGYKMPSIGLGTLAVMEGENIEKALDAALEAGYRHIDTAYRYRNEGFIGTVLKKWFESGKLKREDIFITTKLPATGNHPDKVEFHIKKSLESLQVDYIDLYLIHFPVGFKFNEVPVFPGEVVPTDHIAIWKELEKYVDAGKIRAIGISNFNVKQIQRIYEAARIKPANLQVELHPYLQQKELVNFCQSHNISVTGYGSLGRAGVNEYYKKIGRAPTTVLDILENHSIAKIATTHNKSPAQIILRFFIQKNIIMIPKSTTPKRIRENIDIFNFNLSDEEMRIMESLDRGEAGRCVAFKSDENREIRLHPEFPF